MMNYDLKIMENKDVLDMYSHNVIAEKIKKSLEEKDTVNIALSGGSTPKNAYNFLGQRSDIDWNRVNIFLVDERWVPADDPKSNWKMIRGCFNSTIYPVRTDVYDTPQESAEAYSKTIERIVPGDIPSFDLIILGLGDDGHTASLFPGTDAVWMVQKLVTKGHGAGIDRVTFTIKLINAAKEVMFIICGDGKAEALKKLMNPLQNPYNVPAKLVQTSNQMTIIADEEATKYL